MPAAGSPGSSCTRRSVAVPTVVALNNPNRFPDRCIQASWDGTPSAASAAEGADSATQLELLAAAEGELRVAFDGHMKYLSEVCICTQRYIAWSSAAAWSRPVNQGAFTQRG